MQFNVPPDLEALVQKRLASGAFTSVEEVFRCALEAQIAEDDSREDLQAISAHVEERFRQAERGELIDGDQARIEIRALQDRWLKEHAAK